MLLEQVKETKQKKKFKEKPQWSISSSNNVLLENALVSSKDCQMILISKRLSDTLRNYGIVMELSLTIQLGVRFFSSKETIEKLLLSSSLTKVLLSSQRSKFMVSESARKLYIIRHFGFTKIKTPVF